MMKRKKKTKEQTIPAAAAPYQTPEGLSEEKAKQIARDHMIRRKYALLDAGAFVIGSSCLAVAVNMFTAPNNIAPGGVSGLATMINYLTNLPIGALIVVINIPLFIIAFKVFGTKFIARTVAMTVMSAVFIDVSAMFIVPYSGDKLLASLFGGVLSGFGYGLVLARGATSGGTDIIGRLIRRRFRHLPMGTLVMIMDLLIVLLSGFIYKNIESVLYAAIVFFICGRMSNYVIYGAGNGKMILTVSLKGDEIAREIVTETRRGATIIPVQGAYTGQDQKMLLNVVRPSEVQRIYRIIRSVDPNAFVMITAADEILGFGFTQDE